jgi:VWFA-related protein
VRRNHARALLGSAAAVAAAALSALHPAGQQQKPVFRAGIDVVRVDVLVTEKNRPVTGLREGDFEVFDNGVRQQTRLITEREALTLVLALDTSASVRGKKLRDLVEATRSVLDDVRPGDRVALLTFSERLALECAPTTDLSAVRARLTRLSGAGSTALNDAVFAGVWLAGREAQRSLVLVFSDGRDTMSWLKPVSVEQSIIRSGALVYGVTAGTPERRYAAGPPPDAWRDDPTMDPALKQAYERATRPAGQPAANRAEIAMDDAHAPFVAADGLLQLGGFLQLAAQVSGGRVFEAETSGDLKSTFRKVIDEVRARHVLVFTPAGVGRDDGWHRLEVKLAGTRKGQVTARRGYFAR